MSDGPFPVAAARCPRGRAWLLRKGAPNRSRSGGNQQIAPCLPRLHVGTVQHVLAPRMISKGLLTLLAPSLPAPEVSLEPLKASVFARSLEPLLGLFASSLANQPAGKPGPLMQLAGYHCRMQRSLRFNSLVQSVIQLWAAKRIQLFRRKGIGGAVNLGLQHLAPMQCRLTDANTQVWRVIVAWMLLMAEAAASQVPDRADRPQILNP